MLIEESEDEQVDFKRVCEKDDDDKDDNKIDVVRGGRNGQCRVWSLIPERDAGPGSPSPGWLWWADLGDCINCFIYIYNIYIYIYICSVLLKIHGDWLQDAGDGKKVFLGLAIIRLGCGTRGYNAETPKMVSPNATHKSCRNF